MTTDNFTLIKTSASTKSTPVTRLDGGGWLLLIGSSIMEVWHNFSSLMPGWQVVNRAIGGTTTTYWVERLAAILAEEQPDAVFCYVGSNDVATGASTDDVGEGFRRIREILTAYDSSIPFACLAIIKAPQRVGRFDEIAAANETERKALQPGDLWIDSDPFFLTADDAPIARHYVEDGLHLTTDAYLELTRHISPDLRDWLKNFEPAPRPSIPLIRRASVHAERTAIIDGNGAHTYSDLLDASARVSGWLRGESGDLAEARVAFLVPSSFTYAAVLWGIWQGGGIAVPLCTQHPAHELTYVISDSGAEIVVSDPQYESLLRPVAEALGRRFLLTTEIPATAPASQPDVSLSRGALIVYTSGTTGKPKGALSTHATLTAQIQSLVAAWEWSPNDRIALFLPLHHVHGILNVLSCALWSGASCEMLPGFEPAPAWERIRDDKLTVFMAVPTIYTRLIAFWEAAPDADKAALSAGCRRLRLMVSGSAALPVSVFEKWREISGHALLERYGMTEIGMALSNPLRGQRLPGHVGSPLPGVEVRLVDEGGQLVPDGTPGEIQIHGPTVFREYWGKPEATAATFTADRWFRTGDIAVRQNTVYRILGRSSVDIIKTGGYKVSALEIEEELRNHPAIDQCAVVGVADPEWGERVAAAVVLKPGMSLALKPLRDWAKEFLAVYKIPSLLETVPELPRNAMGKVVKPEVAKFFKKS